MTQKEIARLLTDGCSHTPSHPKTVSMCVACAESIRRAFESFTFRQSPSAT
jgi:hypothetical protein